IPVPYRSSSREIRSYADIPIIELAGLAGPFARLRMNDEQVLRRMAEQFELGRLREAARARFERAITLARSALDGTAQARCLCGRRRTGARPLPGRADCRAREPRRDQYSRSSSDR